MKCKKDAAMIDLANGIDSLTNFKRRTPTFLKQLRKSGQPVVLTINGKAEVIVQNVSAYQRFVELLDRLETIEAIRVGLEEMKAGKGRPAAEVLESIRKKHRIPRHS